MNLVKQFKSNAPALLGFLKQKPEEFWIRRGEKASLDLFKRVSQRVPAYKKFLKEHGVNPRLIKTAKDFHLLPATDKDNYLKKYETEELCWDGRLVKNCQIFSSTSGSTGIPYYFGRGDFQDAQFALTLELLLMDYFKIHEKKTLFIDCFALGIWIGGMFTYEAVSRIVKSKKYDLSVITPGADKAEAIKLAEKLAGKFDQIVIGGYPPLVKDLLDDGLQYGLKWPNYDVKFFFAAEAFTEKFRDYLAEKAGVKNVFTDMLNHYGTADMGTMAHETPASVIIRRLADGNEQIFKKVFLQAVRLPTLAQYIPELYYFETVDGILHCTAPSGFPLIKYNLKDRGGILTLADLRKKFKGCDFDFDRELDNSSSRTTLWNLPFVYLYERSDMVVSIYSVNIYPESIRKSLLEMSVSEYVTGKFNMEVDFDEQQKQNLIIHVELRKCLDVDKEEELKTELLNIIVAQLNEENSEWRDFYADPKIRHKILPRIILHSYQDERYFKPGKKQVWVKKN